MLLQHHNKEVQKGILINPCENSGKAFKKVKRKTGHLSTCGKSVKYDKWNATFKSTEIVSRHIASKHLKSLFPRFVKKRL